MNNRGNSLKPVSIMFAIAIVFIVAAIILIWVAVQNSGHEAAIDSISIQVSEARELEFLLSHQVDLKTTIGDLIVSESNRVESQVALYFKGRQYSLSVDGVVVAKSSKVPEGVSISSTLVGKDGTLLVVELTLK
jgi:hypothetical protein